VWGALLALVGWYQGSFEKGDIAWFTNGKINVSWNCLDRHIKERGDQTAIIWESDEVGTGRSYTYSEVLEETCKVANVLKSWGVKKGDTVAVYMPMIPEVAFVMLACARIGAPHSIVFAGFSANSLRDRIVDASSKWVICADEGKRGGRTVALKTVVDEGASAILVVLVVGDDTRVLHYFCYWAGCATLRSHVHLFASPRACVLRALHSSCRCFV